MISNNLPLGGIAILDKVEKEYSFVSKIFKGVAGKSKDFEGRVKVLLHNRLTHAVSIHQILPTSSPELFELLGMKDTPSERSLYRALKIIGQNFSLVHEKYQGLLMEYKLICKKQIVDSSSSFLEGNKTDLAKHGYSRDKRPDKRQINFGISTGINDIPTALTISSGNSNDHVQMKHIVNIAGKVLAPKSLFIFDSGGNSANLKKKIRMMKFHYLTFRQKKLKTYKRYIKNFKIEDAVPMLINDRCYFCIKKKEKDEIKYIFFCEELWEDQIRKKEKKFKRQKEKGNKKLKERKHMTLPSDKGWVELEPVLQETLAEIDNPYINNIEGFFILESSVDASPVAILKLYKERDKAEKFIRDLKEGIEMRPIRHWSKDAIIGALFISFLAKALINLTLISCKNPLVKNLKLLKKYLINLSVTIIYPKNAFRVLIVSNVSPPIRAIFDDFLDRYGQKELDLRW